MPAHRTNLDLPGGQGGGNVGRVRKDFTIKDANGGGFPRVCVVGGPYGDGPWADKPAHLDGAVPFLCSADHRHGEVGVGREAVTRNACALVHDDVQLHPTRRQQLGGDGC